MFYGNYRSAALFDPDGPGPSPESLYVTGDFNLTIYPGVVAHGIVRWDGVSFGLGPLLGPAAIDTLQVFDLDGAGPNPPRLIMGGVMAAADPRSANLAATDGTNLLPIPGFNAKVRKLLVIDVDGNGPGAPELYAAGDFTMSGTTPILSGVARWTGAGWQAVGQGMSGHVFDLMAFDPDGSGPQPTMLVAAGDIAVGGLPAGVAFLSGTTWTNPDARISGQVKSIAAFDFGDGAPARLVAAGSFLVASGMSGFTGQAYYDGTIWRPIAPLSPPSSGSSIGVFDPDGPGGTPAQLLLSGNLSIIAGELHHLARFENGQWAPLLGTNVVGFVNSMVQLAPPGQSDPVLFMAGGLAAIDFRVPLTLLTWDGESPSPLTDGFNHSVEGMATTNVTGAPSVVACGDFYHVPGAPAWGVAIFDGDHWAPLGNVARSDVGVNADCVFAYDPDGDGPLHEVVVLGGGFPGIAGIPAMHVAMFDGQSWSAMGSGVPIYPRDFAAFDPDADGPAPLLLIACGGYSSGASQLYQWDGAQWTEFGPLFTAGSSSTGITNLTTFDPDGAGPRPRELIVNGLFTQAGDVPARNIAAFDGAAWHPLGPGLVQSNALGLATWDPNHDGHEVIVVGGGFDMIGDVHARGVAVWNGDSWSSLGGGFFDTSSGRPGIPRDFVSFDIDGDGPLPESLYATGSFDQADDHHSLGIARWTGSVWQPVGSGLDFPGGRCLAVLPGSSSRPPELCVGGTFQAAGGLPNAYFASFSGVDCCPADFNHDGAVGSDDLFAYLTEFFAGSPEGDFNSDGTINSADFFDFVSAFFGAC